MAILVLFITDIAINEFHQYILIFVAFTNISRLIMLYLEYVLKINKIHNQIKYI